jgi:glycosyltransferase involved in cell wall biosynthesis
MTYEDMPSYLGALGVLICTASSEGGPLPPLQAAACGVPTVSTRCGHMPEFMIEGETGFLVDGDVRSFMDKLEVLAADRSMLLTMGRAARSHVEDRWTIESKGIGWIRMLEGLR